jgi:hypothetical protein
MQGRIFRILRFQSQVECLTQVLRQVSKAVNALQRGGWIHVFEYEVSRGFQFVAKSIPGFLQIPVERGVSEGHRCS